MLKRSFVLTALLPSAAYDAAMFYRGVELLAQNGVEAIEYYAPPKELSSRNMRLGGLDSIFLLAAHQKAAGENLASPDGGERKIALESAAEHMEYAIDAGFSGILLTSGGYTGPTVETEAMRALEESLEMLAQQSGGRIKLLLEPGDREVQFNQLIGPTSEAVALMERLGGRVELTMDVSHIAQLGEDVHAALELARPHCGHVHLANCVLDRGSPLYGDKHPPFGVDRGRFSEEDAKQILQRLEGEYSGALISAEIISREREEWAYFERAVASLSWFFTH